MFGWKQALNKLYMNNISTNMMNFIKKSIKKSKKKKVKWKLRLSVHFSAHVNLYILLDTKIIMNSHTHFSTLHALNDC